MLPSSDAPTTSDRSRQLKRYGPFAVIIVVILIAVGVAVASGGGGDDDAGGGGGGGTATTTAGGTTGPADPEGAISFSRAEEEGLDVEFAESCDTETGRIKIPFFFSPECYANADDNGGATSPGVTGETITLVIYVSPDTDPIIEYITAAIKNEDTNDQVKETWQGYADMFNALYQTYGRKIDVKFLDASGGAQDEVAARADAVKVAEELKAFAVLGGPALTSAFADELAAREIVCIGCTAGGPSFYDERQPYLFSVASNAQQVLLHVVEYIGKKLAGRPAEFAGDDLKTTERKIGYLWIESNDDSKAQAELMESRLAEVGVTLAESVPYTLDPARLQEQATSAIAKMKSSGVTTILFSGDPVAPTSFTQEATAQDYFPEWLLGPQVLVDTNAFSRTYDQAQWAHAFGVSPLAARTNPSRTDAYRLYEWFNGVTPPAKDTNAVMFPNISLFAYAVQAAGPNLTPETLKAGLFSRSPAEGVITQPSISFGNHDLWDFDDYNGVDDTTEIWWDPEATGPDEIRKEGQGMWRFVDGGKRYLPGAWTEDDSKAFDPEGTITLLEAPPEDETPPDYPSPAGGN